VRPDTFRLSSGPTYLSRPTFTAEGLGGASPTQAVQQGTERSGTTQASSDGDAGNGDWSAVSGPTPWWVAHHDEQLTKRPMPTNPKISVCIPTYRGATHLAAAIDSVLAQDFTDFELVIIDDHSPDDTAAVVAHYRDDRIRYVRNLRNLGPEGNWNRCLEEARGEYFKLLPQDDALAPTCLRRQATVLAEDEEHKIALVFCARSIVNSKGRIVAHRVYPSSKDGVFSGKAVIRACVRRGTNLIGEPGAVMFRKSLAESVGRFDGSLPYVIDLDYWFRLLATGNAYGLRAPLASFRVSSGSWSVAIGSRQSRDFSMFVDKFMQRQSSGITGCDVVSGKAMAKINNYLRLWFYRFMLS